MEKYYLAIDIGASGGRHILGHLENGVLITEEIYRFDNSAKQCDNRLIWDIDALFGHVLAGMRRCADVGKIPAAVGIDTWGVDFVLLDERGGRIGPVVSYRDLRTEGMEDEVEKKIPFERLYAKTGIQRQRFNTIYQLAAVKRQNFEMLSEAACMLMLPDYLSCLLTGEKAWEYTNATTTGLVNAASKDWDYEIIDTLELPRRLFGKICPPGTVLGNLSADISAAVGYDTRVFMSTSHDTASAIAAIPGVSENLLYISSGTWSLMGTESKSPICSDDARECNLTNEGGYEYRYRVLKNIMGLWMLQRVREELCPGMDYRTISDAAAMATIDSTVDVNDGAFLSPRSMVREIRDYLTRTGQKLPVGIGEFARVIYRSLAKCYKTAMDELERVTGKKFTELNIVGGGSQSDFLNQQTANEMQRPVFAGPTEGTAIGNLTVLMIANGEIGSLEEGRRIIARSVAIKKYEPEEL